MGSQRRELFILPTGVRKHIKAAVWNLEKWSDFSK